MKRIFLLAFVVASACQRVINPAEDEQAIRSILKEQTECWNNGDLTCFMEGYWKSDSLMFIGSRGPTYGWQTTLDNYRKSYPDKAAMGQLTFTILELNPVAADAWFCVGKWELQRESDKPSGHFTLLWRRIDERWVITVDHSS